MRRLPFNSISQVKLPRLEDAASRDLEKLLKEVKECEDVDFDLDSSTNNTSQPSLVEEPIKSQDALQTFAKSSGSQPLTYSGNKVRSVHFQSSNMVLVFRKKLRAWHTSLCR